MLGSPIQHSLSPALHRAAYAALGLDWTYDRFEVEAAGLAGFVAACGPEWRGLSLTMPLKEAALALGEVDEVARLAGAANTLVFEPDGSRRVLNTDVGGLAWAVRQVVPAGGCDRVTVLGAGATARSSLISAAQLGAGRVVVVARTPARAAPLVELGQRLGVEVSLRAWSPDLPEADLVVCTATSGAADGIADAVAASAPVVFDAVYDPWPTVLAVAAERAGRTVLNGLDLLVGQALLQLEAMTGQTVPPGLLLDAGRAELARRAGSVGMQTRPGAGG
ncbi:MAG: aroE [Friedmanniella sp.]|nr:aroE [Friedmanniella sp.]